MLTAEDRKQLSQKGISEQQIETQLQQFREGFPYLRLRGAAAIGAGIVAPGDAECQAFVEAWEAYKREGHHITKFVPASGAASRMFKNMFEFRDGDHDAPVSDFERTYFERLHDFAFFPALDDACEVLYGCGADALMAKGQYKQIVSAMLDEEGLNYGQLPKGLLQFHAYPDCARTPLEEHLVEAALYAASDGQADVHFTVSAEHRELFEELVERILPAYEEKFNIKFHVSFSEQKPSTDTLAATMDNEPFRTEDGRLLFRPGGHGALIQNLSDLESEVVFIKNIDNVVPDRLKPATTLGKQVIAGVLVVTQRQAFDYLLKPPTEQDLSLLMARYYENKLASIPNLTRTEERLPIILVVNAMNEHVALNLSDIAFFRFNQERKIWEIVCCNNVVYTLRHRTTTSVILNYSPDFVQIHKRYIVNINKIKMIQESLCILEEPLDEIRELKISKNYRQSFMSAFYSM